MTEQQLVKILQDRGKKAFRIGAATEAPVRKYTKARRVAVAAAPTKRAS